MAEWLHNQRARPGRRAPPLRGNFVSEHLLRFGFIPELGIAGPWTLFVLSLHVIWSIGAPIAIAEAVFPAPFPGRTPVAPQTQPPWLAAPAIIVAGLLLPRRSPRGIRPFGPAAAFSVVVTSAYVVPDRIGGGLSPWLAVALALLLLALGVVVAATLRLDVLGLAAGAILTYSWRGMSKAVPLWGRPGDRAVPHSRRRDCCARGRCTWRLRMTRIED